MSSIFDEDDETDFTGTSSNRLASIFKSDSSTKTQQQQQQASTKSSKQQQQQQQPKNESNQQQSTASSLLFSTSVQVFKYVNNNYENQGKTGLAIISNQVNNQLVYRLLLYVTRTQPLATIRITNNYKLVIQANNYASFYDDTNQPWSVMFDTESVLVQFVSQIMLCRLNLLQAVNSSDKDKPIVQDLKLINTNEPLVEANDSIEATTLVTLCKDMKLDETVENTQSKPFKAKLSKGKLPKLVEDSIVNVKQGGRRLVIAQANKFQPFYANIQQNSYLFYDINVLRIKKSSSKETNDEHSLNSEVTQNRERTDSVKERTRTLNEQIDDSTKSDKSKLISRMAKMGKATLPLSGAVVANIESDEEEHEYTKKAVPLVQQQQQQQMQPQVNIPQQVNQIPYSTIPQTQFIPQNQHVNIPLTNQAMDPNTAAFYQQQMQQQQQQQQLYPFNQTAIQNTNQISLYKPPVPANQLMNFIQPTPPAVAQQPLIDDLNTRNQQQQQTLVVKLDTINEKLEQIKSIQQTIMLNSQSNTNLPNMETSVLLQNIQRIVKENDQYKKELYEKSGKIEEQNSKITELLARNQNFVEKSHALLEQKNESFQTSAEKNALRVLELEQDKMRLTAELSKSTSNISELNLQINRFQMNENDLKQRLNDIGKNMDNYKQELDRLRLENAELQTKYDNYSDEIKKERLSKKQIEIKLNELIEERNELKSSLNSLEKQYVDRKSRFDIEKQQFDEELDEIKKQHINEVKELKEKLSKVKTSANQVNSEQVRQLESELTAEWQTKCDKMLKLQEQKYQRTIDQLNEEKNEALKRVDELKEQMKTLRSSTSQSEIENETLKQNIDELNVFKAKYERLQNQAISMKERYEARIQELLEAEPDAEVIAEEIKKVMNLIYRKLKTQIKPEQYYVGNGILSAMLKIIKMTTIQIMRSSEENNGEDDGEVDFFSQHIFDFEAKLRQQQQQIEEQEEQIRQQQRLAASTLSYTQVANNSSNTTTETSSANQFEYDEKLDEYVSIIQTKKTKSFDFSENNTETNETEINHHENVTITTNVESNISDLNEESKQDVVNTMTSRQESVDENENEESKENKIETQVQEDRDDENKIKIEETTEKDTFGNIETTENEEIENNEVNGKRKNTETGEIDSTNDDKNKIENENNEIDSTSKQEENKEHETNEEIKESKQEVDEEETSVYDTPLPQDTNNSDAKEDEKKEEETSVYDSPLPQDTNNSDASAKEDEKKEEETVVTEKKEETVDKKDTVTKKTSLFGDDDDDDEDGGLFKPKPPSPKKEIIKKTVKLFSDDEDDDDFFSTTKNTTTTTTTQKPKPENESKSSEKPVNNDTSGAPNSFEPPPPLTDDNDETKDDIDWFKQ